MASAAEQLMSTISFSSFAKAEELQKRIGFTLMALIIYRLGTFIPAPGIDPGIMVELSNQHSGGLLSMFNTFGGGALFRMTVFALSIVPYISASIIMQLMSSVVPSLEQIKKEGEVGRRKINQYTRYLTVLIASFQSFSMALYLQSLPDTPVVNPGYFFLVSFVLTLVGGTLFLMWIGEQITARGLGQGSSLIIFTGIITGLPQALAVMFEQVRTKALSAPMAIIVLGGALVIIAFIVFFERSYRKVPIQYPRRQVGNKIMGGGNSHLPLKLNTAGVIPPIFAGAILSSFTALIGLDFIDKKAGWLSALGVYLVPTSYVYMAIYVGLMAFFAFFYTSVVFNADETADNLKKNGAIVQGVRPGKQTADFITFVLNRLTSIGAIYISFVCVLPLLLGRLFDMPLGLGGTGILIVVSVTIETINQINSHLIGQQYEGLMKKQRGKGAGRK